MGDKKKCEKCSFESHDLKEKQGLFFCNVCFVFAPENPEKLDKYLQEKINSEAIHSFRKYIVPSGHKQKTGMIQKAKTGNLMSRAPFGYGIENKKLIPNEDFRKVEAIFEDFLNSKTSLNKLAIKHGFSINGLKKILTNFTYVGKIKFNGEVYEGSHEPIISSTLFNHVQNKIENLGLKKIN